MRGWEVAGPQNPLVGIMAKLQEEAKLFSSLKKKKNICGESITISSIFIPGHYLNTDHHFSLLLKLAKGFI